MRCFVLVAASAAMSACSPSIHDMALRGHVGELRESFDAQPGLIESRDQLGKTPLHYAVLSGNTETVELLLSKGAVFDAGDDTGLTPLHVAAIVDFKPMVGILVEAGASLSSQDAFGDTPVHSAAMHGSVRALNEFLKRDDIALDGRNHNGLTPLALAESLRQNSIVARLRIATDGP